LIVQMMDMTRSETLTFLGTDDGDPDHCPSSFC
jgi:hypothetical protein